MFNLEMRRSERVMISVRSSGSFLEFREQYQMEVSLV